MDDGCYIPNRGLRLCTNSFIHEDVVFLSNLLNKKFGLQNSIHKADTLNSYTIYVHKKSLSDLIVLVKPFVIPSMLYKLGLN
jgi:hypothetical protein